MRLPWSKTPMERIALSHIKDGKKIVKECLDKKNTWVDVDSASAVMGRLSVVLSDLQYKNTKDHIINEIILGVFNIWESIAKRNKLAAQKITRDIFRDMPGVFREEYLNHFFAIVVDDKHLDSSASEWAITDFGLNNVLQYFDLQLQVGRTDEVAEYAVFVSGFWEFRKDKLFHGWLSKQNNGFKGLLHEELIAREPFENGVKFKYLECYKALGPSYLEDYEQRLFARLHELSAIITGLPIVDFTEVDLYLRGHGISGINDTLSKTHDYREPYGLLYYGIRKVVFSFPFGANDMRYRGWVDGGKIIQAQFPHLISHCDWRQAADASGTDMIFVARTGEDEYVCYSTVGSSTYPKLLCDG